MNATRLTTPLCLVIGATLLGACSPSPEATAAEAYATALTPLLYENGLLAVRVLTEAARAHDGHVTPAELRTSWHQDIVPLADHLLWQASSTTVPPAWAADHEGLVAAWKLRSDAYRDLDAAVTTGDRERWQEARDAADRAKINEETWFRAADDRLMPFGIALDQYP